MLDIKSEGIRELADSLEQAIRNSDKFVEAVFSDMGPKIASLMNRALEPHKYSGDLGNSIRWKVVPGKRMLVVGSDHRRRSKFNSMSLLDRGTGPIPSLPFTPIAKWAAFKGLPAGPVWMKIRQSGVSPHPIMDRLEAEPAFSDVLNQGAKKLATDLLVEGFGVQKRVKG